jgi:glycine cleavage system aminomethyltransferase T
MQDLRGKAKRRLVPLVLEGNAVVPKGTAVLDGATGDGIGEITSAAFSDRLKSPVAMAALKAGYESTPTLLVEGAKARVLTRA